jgi:hypothetical protein
MDTQRQMRTERYDPRAERPTDGLAGTGDQASGRRNQGLAQDDRVLDLAGGRRRSADRVLWGGGQHQPQRLPPGRQGLVVRRVADHRVSGQPSLAKAGSPQRAKPGTTIDGKPDRSAVAVNPRRAVGPPRISPHHRMGTRDSSARAGRDCAESDRNQAASESRTTAQPVSHNGRGS